MATDPMTDMLRDFLAEASARFPEEHFVFMSLTPNATGFETAAASNVDPKSLSGVLRDYADQCGDDEVVYESRVQN